jgi:hypothetical protein
MKGDEKQKETWESEVKSVITESQLIHLNDCANSIVEAREEFDPNEIEYLKKIIDTQRRTAVEIKRMLKYINNEVEIKERRVWSEKKNPTKGLLDNIDDGIDLNEGD